MGQPHTNATSPPFLGGQVECARGCPPLPATAGGWAAGRGGTLASKPVQTPRDVPATGQRHWRGPGGIAAAAGKCVAGADAASTPRLTAAPAVLSPPPQKKPSPPATNGDGVGHAPLHCRQGSLTQLGDRVGGGGGKDRGWRAHLLQPGGDALPRGGGALGDPAMAWPCGKGRGGGKSWRLENAAFHPAEGPQPDVQGRRGEEDTGAGGSGHGPCLRPDGLGDGHDGILSPASLWAPSGARPGLPGLWRRAPPSPRHLPRLPPSHWLAIVCTDNLTECPPPKYNTRWTAS